MKNTGNRLALVSHKLSQKSDELRATVEALEKRINDHAPGVEVRVGDYGWGKSGKTWGFVKYLYKEGDEEGDKRSVWNGSRRDVVELCACLPQIQEEILIAITRKTQEVEHAVATARKATNAMEGGGSAR